jgi:hypothetical protein
MEHPISAEIKLTPDRLREIINTLTAIVAVGRTDRGVFLAPVKFDAMMFELLQHANGLAHLGPICPACEAGDHGDACRLCAADYRCACACRGKVV